LEFNFTGYCFVTLIKYILPAQSGLLLIEITLNLGKTISKKLSKKQVEVCKTYIENNKKLKAIIDQMRNLSSKLLDFE